MPIGVKKGLIVEGRSFCGILCRLYVLWWGFNETASSWGCLITILFISTLEFVRVCFAVRIGISIRKINP
jgi:hypothetical protein